MIIKKWKIVSTRPNIFYYRDHIVFHISAPLDLMKNIENIQHTGLTWVPALMPEAKPLELLTFIATEEEAQALNDKYLPDILGVMEHE